MPGLHDVSLPLAWSNVGWPLLVSLVVGLSFLGIGVALLQAAARGRKLTGVELTVAPALGMLVLGYVSDLIFMTGGVDMRPVYRAEVAVGLGLLVWRFRHVRLRAAPAPAAPWTDRALWTVGWAVVAWFACELIVGNVSPVNDGDSFFHYALYSQSLSRGVTFDEILLLKNFPFADLNRIIEHVYAAAGTLGGVGSLHLMNLAFITGIALVAQGLSAGVLRICRWTNPLPILAFLSLRELVYTGYSAKLDYGVALFELTALVLWLTWRDRRLWMLVLGLGLTLCARTNSLRFALVIPVLWLADQWWYRREEGSLRAMLVRTVAVGAGVLAVASPPYLMHAFIYGNPLFPMFNSVLGHYRHYYEWTVLETLRYRTDYGWFAPVAVYVQMALLDWTAIPGVRLPPNTGYGMSALMLMAPLAIRRDRRYLWLLGFVGLGYITWYAQAHTHRTGLSFAVVAVVLAVAVIAALRRRLAPLYFAGAIAVAALAAWSASDFLGFNSLKLDYYYAYGGWTKADYNDNLMKTLYGDRVLTSAELSDIYAIVGDAHLAAMNLAPFSDPRLIRTKRLMISSRSMAAIADDPDAEDTDRRVAREQLDSAYLNQQARDVSARLWPADGVQRPLQQGADFRWYLTASYDALQFIGDDVLAEPARLAPMLRFEGVRYLLAPRRSVYGTQSFADLTEVWRSDAAILFRVEPR